MARSIRKLEDLGYVQRVRAPGNIRISPCTLHRCVKLIHEPTEEEWQAFFQLKTDATEVQEPKGQDDDTSEDDNEEGVEETNQVDKSLQGNINANDPSGHEIVKLAQHRLLWTPDRPLVNLLYDAVHASATKGLTSAVCLSNKKWSLPPTHFSHRTSKTMWSGFSLTDP